MKVTDVSVSDLTLPHLLPKTYQNLGVTWDKLGDGWWIAEISAHNFGLPKGPNAQRAHFSREQIQQRPPVIISFKWSSIRQLWILNINGSWLKPPTSPLQYICLKLIIPWKFLKTQNSKIVTGQLCLQIKPSTFSCSPSPIEMSSTYSKQRISCGRCKSSMLMVSVKEMSHKKN